jgi:hypothetical protein
MICSAEIFRTSGVNSTFRCRTELLNASMSAYRYIFGASGASGCLSIHVFLEDIRRCTKIRNRRKAFGLPQQFETPAASIVG